MSGVADHPNRRRFLTGGALVAVGLAASGCGFSPVYGGRSAGAVQGVENDLAAVEIGYFQDREGQILRNLLLDRFNPRGVSGQTTYRLNGTVSVSSSDLGTQIDATTTRSQVIVQVQASLEAFGTSHPMGSRGVASYSTSDSTYASDVARAAAIERSLAVVADDIRLQVATFFEKQRRLRG